MDVGVTRLILCVVGRRGGCGGEGACGTALAVSAVRVLLTVGGTNDKGRSPPPSLITGAAPAATLSAVAAGGPVEGNTCGREAAAALDVVAGPPAFAVTHSLA